MDAACTTIAAIIIIIMFIMMIIRISYVISCDSNVDNGLDILLLLLMSFPLKSAITVVLYHFIVENNVKKIDAFSIFFSIFHLKIVYKTLQI